MVDQFQYTYVGRFIACKVRQLSSILMPSMNFNLLAFAPVGDYIMPMSSDVITRERRIQCYGCFSCLRYLRERTAAGPDGIP